MKVSLIVGMVLFLVATGAAGWAMVNLMATRVGPGRHRRRRLAPLTVIAFVGAWELAVGVFLILAHDGTGAIGPIGIGLAMIAAPFVARHFRLPGE